jgi:hypothetical protein
MAGFFKRLFGGGTGSNVHTAEAIDYKGFQIIATPRQVSGGWSTEGLIRKQIDGEDKEVAFIRADTCMSTDDAVKAAQGKGHKIIDERGDAVFDSERA